MDSLRAPWHRPDSIIAGDVDWARLGARLLDCGIVSLIFEEKGVPSVIIKVNGYVVSNPRCGSGEFQVGYTPEQIVEFLIRETKPGGVVIVESAYMQDPRYPVFQYGEKPGPVRDMS